METEQPTAQFEHVAEFIRPLNMNGLQGRMLVAPPTRNKKREILMVYGHHAMLERWWSLVENYRELGTVTMPDLPGFGGMDNFFKAGRQPSIDNFADYLAAFIRFRYKKKRITIVGISFGFLVATRMLQRYPDLAKRVDFCVSIVGFMHRDDFMFKPRNRYWMRGLARFFGVRAVSYLFRYIGLNGPVIRLFYANLPAGKRRLSTMDPIEAKAMLDFDVQLWHLNDVATHWRTTAEFLDIDNCKSRIELPVWHIGSENDHYFNNQNVEQHLLVVFNDCKMSMISAKAHTPSVLAGKDEMKMLLPAALKRVLAKQ